MAFSGRDYHAAFDEACKTLPFEGDVDEVRSQLEGIEWILWEAIRGVFLYAAVFTGIVPVLAVQLTIGERGDWTLNAIALVATIVIACSAYWMLQLIFHFEISAHVKGCKFGSGGLD